MAELQNARKRSVRHRDRITQVPIYLGKLLRSFIYQNDWKVLPMSGIIAALVSMVTRREFCVTMEGTLMGAFSLSCVAIWNGCFNSIQSVCRERNIVKREHRSGMHISAYICAHMIYQALLCLAQAILMVIICKRVGMKFPEEGLVTGSFMIDMVLTLFFISYASDMISLFVSSVSHTTTGAMTVMPFLMIFQLVFSGGVFSLPTWAQPITNFAISNYGMRCIASQADYNSKPLVTAWNTIVQLKSKEIDHDITLREITELLADEDNGIVRKVREEKLTSLMTVDEVNKDTDEAAVLETIAEYIPEDATVGDLLDDAMLLPIVQQNMDHVFNIRFTIGDLLDMIGEENTKELIQRETAHANYKPAYEHDPDNVMGYWLILIGFAAFFAALCTISLEFIDKDKR